MGGRSGSGRKRMMTADLTSLFFFFGSDNESLSDTSLSHCFGQKNK